MNSLIRVRRSPRTTQSIRLPAQRHVTDHTMLVAAAKAARLVETPKGKGPFTMFAPTNA